MGLSTEQKRELARDLCIESYGCDPETMRGYTELYRWLRAHLVGVIHLIGDQAIGVSGLTGDEFDASIRAAMRAEKFPGCDIDAVHRKA